MQRRVTVHLTAAAALAAALSGCLVPAARYDQVRSELRGEQTAHRRTLRQLHQIRRQLERARGRLTQGEAHNRKLQGRLEQLQQLAAQTELDASIVAQERREATRLVDQLRGELERAAHHLRSFAEDRSELAEALAGAQARLERLQQLEHQVALRALVVRDLTLALHEPLAAGEYELVVEEGQVVLRVPATRIFASPAGALHPEATRLLAALAAVAIRHGDARIAVAETGANGQPERAARLGSIVQGLSQQGVDRTMLSVSMPDDAPTEASSTAADPDPGAGDSAQPAAATVAFAISPV